MSESDRTVIITGSSSGIGAAIALEFARLGWTVALGARRVERLENVARQVEEAGGRPFLHALDVREPESIDAFCTATEAQLGPVDVLVNNAGQNLPARVAEATPEELRSDVEINLLGAMWMTRRVVPAMIERRLGDVVFIGSDSAINPRPFQSAYGASKMGLEVFAKVLEMETEGTGVRSILFRVGPTSSEFGSNMSSELIQQMLESWKYWGVVRNIHWMTAETVARTIARTVLVPVEEYYPTVVELQPGGRFQDPES
jgi:NADP-dependent 3-hydroxy acid dehydrogenase YdfG